MKAQLVVEKGGRRRQTYQMQAEELIIGRRKGCGLRIPAASVSRQHCRLYEDDGFLMVEDLGSSNGTILNGEVIAGVEIARPGDRLQVGSVIFIVEYELSEESMEQLEEVNGSGQFEIVDEEGAAKEEAPMELLMELAEEEAQQPDANKDADAAAPMLLQVEDEDDEDAFLLPLEDEEESSGPLEQIDFDNSGPLELEEAEFRDFLSQLDEDAKE